MSHDASAFLPLLDNAGPGPRQRGQDLADRGMVSIQTVSGTVVEARVQGTVRYRVSLNGGDP